MHGGLYQAYMKPREEKPEESTVLVRERFSLAAFIFGPLWALFHHLWGVAALLILAGLFFSFAAQHGLLGVAALSAVQMIIGIWLGCEAADLRAVSLERKGYVLTDVIQAANEDEAMIRLIHRHAA